MQVQDYQRDIAIPQKEVGGFGGSGGAMAAQPEEAITHGGGNGGGIKGITSIHQNDGLLDLLWLLQQSSDEETGTAAFAFTDDFREGAFA